MQHIRQLRLHSGGNTLAAIRCLAYADVMQVEASSGSAPGQCQKSLSSFSAYFMSSEGRRPMILIVQGEPIKFHACELNFTTSCNPLPSLLHF